MRRPLLEAVALVAAVLFMPGFLLLGTAWWFHKKWGAFKLRRVK